MPTLNQQKLARQLKLSRTTVSRSLSNHPAISAETRARVQELAATMGYTNAPTRTVRRPRQAKPITLGVLIGHPLVNADRATFPYILEGIRRRAEIEHAAIDVVSMSPEKAAGVAGQREIFQHIRKAHWRGAILIYPFIKSTVETLSSKISTISVLNEYHDLGIDVVDTDHENVRLFIDHLAGLGHKRIGFVSWHYDVGGLWAQRRFAAFAEGIYAHGLELNPQWVVNIGAAGKSLPSVSAIADHVVQCTRREHVTAWVCAADHQAYQLIADIQNRGLRVPRDCSVTGFDGNEPPPGLPSLTTLKVPNDEIGSCAVARLLSRLLAPTSPRRKTLVENTFIQGASTATAPKA